MKAYIVNSADILSRLKNPGLVLSAKDIIDNPKIRKIPVYEVCDNCGKADETVSTRFCGYQSDINGSNVEETICDDCEHEHLMDI